MADDLGQKSCKKKWLCDDRQQQVEMGLFVCGLEPSYGGIVMRPGLEFRCGYRVDLSVLPFCWFRNAIFSRLYTFLRVVLGVASWIASTAVSMSTVNHSEPFTL